MRGILKYLPLALIFAGASLLGAGPEKDPHAAPKATPPSHPATPPAPPAAKPALKPAPGVPTPAPEVPAPDAHNDHAEPASTKPAEPAKEPPAATPNTTTPVAIIEATTPTAPVLPPIDAIDGGLTADQALAALSEGNARWVSGKPANPASDAARRQATSTGQKPFVTVLTCADSRLPVERLFDRGVGEVFVLRVAGNIAGAHEAGTIEYGVGHLNTPLLVVMGHSKCGAVAAAASGAQVHGNVGVLLAAITPAVERAKRNNPNLSGDELVAAVVKENVWQSVFDLLKSSSDLRQSLAAGKLKVVGAVCDISTGKVEFLGEHPWQKELIAAMNAQPAATPASNTAPAVHAEAGEGH